LPQELPAAELRRAPADQKRRALSGDRGRVSPNVLRYDRSTLYRSDPIPKLAGVVFQGEARPSYHVSKDFTASRYLLRTEDPRALSGRTFHDHHGPKCFRSRLSSKNIKLATSATVFILMNFSLEKLMGISYLQTFFDNWQYADTIMPNAIP
jgi:hypothetical protein